MLMLTIIHGIIKTMAGTDYEDGFVQIENGKIKALGSMTDYSQFKGNERVIDAKGNLVMPGIIEAHCHMGITEEKKGMTAMKMSILLLLICELLMLLIQSMLRLKMH